MIPAIEVNVEDDAWLGVPGLEGRLAETMAICAQEAGVRLAPGAEVSVLLCGDDTIRDLNRTWRSIDRPTNVLSFPAAPPERLGDAPLLGDIAIAHGTVAREAAAEGKTIVDHTTHLAVHGFLHLIGHDHEDDAQAERMERLEVRILARLGVPDPYAEPAAVEARAAVR